MWTLANILTLARIASLPLLLFLLTRDGAFIAWVCLGLYILAAVTDYLDGYLARTQNQITAIGKFLDPISDKIFVGCLLIMLVADGRLPDFWVIPALIIMARELLISGLREYLGPYNIQIPVSPLAKWKTALQMIALGFLVIGDYGDSLIPNSLLIGQIGLTIAAIITVMTGWSYLKVGLNHMLEQDNQPKDNPKRPDKD